MALTRTTLRIEPSLKKAAQEQALQNNTTLQDIFNRALQDYLTVAAKQKARKIVFKTHNLGAPLDNLKRSDYYPKP